MGTQPIEQRGSAPAGDARRLIFISHANPQDNAVAAWFATRLTLLGYEVWCDLKNTHGGESDFWPKVQSKIENEAAKFVFILSNTSRDLQSKRGLLKEVQTADNLHRDNFIIPVRIEKLTGSVPILISPDIYIGAESWADGLRELKKRFVNDDVPVATDPDLGQLASWWPALQVREKVVTATPTNLISNLTRFEALPRLIHVLSVKADGNPLSGYQALKEVLPGQPAHAPQGALAISFGRAADFGDIPPGYRISDEASIPTESFIREGYPAGGIQQVAAQRVTTFLIASALETFLSARGLRYKEVSYSRKRTWFAPYGLVPGNKHSLSEGGRRPSPASFVGNQSYRAKKYIWHFGVQPSVDLHTHMGVLFAPKAVLSTPYRSDKGEKPFPVDHKKALRNLSWWNREWRTKTLAFLAWLANDDNVIRIPVGYQEILLTASPQIFASEIDYRDVDDDALIKDILGWSE